MSMPAVQPQMLNPTDPQQALIILDQVTAHDSLRLSRAEHRAVEQALRTLQEVVNPPAPLPEEEPPPPGTITPEVLAQARRDAEIEVGLRPPPPADPVTEEED